MNRMGVRKLSLLKTYSRDFEKYIGTYYDFQVLRTKKTSQEVSLGGRGLRLRLHPRGTSAPEGEPSGSERFLNTEGKN